MSRTIMRTTGLMLLILLVCLGVGGIAVYTQCEALKAKPITPIYPNAVLVNENVQGLSGPNPFVVEYFTSIDAPEKIVDFYKRSAKCTINPTRTLCEGEARSYGHYSVYIDTPSVKEAISNFFVEISWNGCAWFR